jgi:hypothetical protein
MEKKMTDTEFAGMSDEEFATYVSSGGWMVRSDAVHIYIKAELLRRLGAAVSASPQPRCPKCQSGMILLNYNLWVDDGRRSRHKATCLDCEYEPTLDSTPADFAQFFAPAPAQEPNKTEEVFQK